LAPFYGSWCVNHKHCRVENFKFRRGDGRKGREEWEGEDCEEVGKGRGREERRGITGRKGEGKKEKGVKEREGANGKGRTGKGQGRAGEGKEGFMLRLKHQINANFDPTPSSITAKYSIKE